MKGDDFLALFARHQVGDACDHDQPLERNIKSEYVQLFQSTTYLHYLGIDITIVRLGGT